MKVSIIYAAVFSVFWKKLLPDSIVSAWSCESYNFFRSNTLHSFKRCIQRYFHFLLVTGLSLLWLSSHWTRHYVLLECERHLKRIKGIFCPSLHFSLSFWKDLMRWKGLGHFTPTLASALMQSGVWIPKRMWGCVSARRWRLRVSCV